MPFISAFDVVYVEFAVVLIGVSQCLLSRPLGLLSKFQRAKIQ